MDSNDPSERYIANGISIVSGVLVVLVLGVIGVVTYFCFFNGIVFFSWHPPLMLTAVSVFIL